MQTPIRKLAKEHYPELLKQISSLPPHMDMQGLLPPEDYKYLCIIGARHNTTYGAEVCSKLISGLRGYRIAVVSGLAIGIDSLAHEEALKAGLHAVAFPGSGLAENVLYPASSRGLAKRIIAAGGAILSPFKIDKTGGDWTFPARNRLMAGISQATLIIEAAEESGTLITAECAANFNRDLLVVPNSILIPNSKGSNALLRDGGIAVTSPEDILEELGFTDDNKPVQSNMFDFSNLSLSAEEMKILESLRREPLTSSDIIEKTGLPTPTFNIKISELELRGLVVERAGRYRFAMGKI